MTQEEAAYAAAWLAECWQPCREVRRDIRAGWAALAKADRQWLDEHQGEADIPVPFPGAA